MLLLRNQPTLRIADHALTAHGQVSRQLHIYVAQPAAARGMGLWVFKPTRFGPDANVYVQRYSTPHSTPPWGDRKPAQPYAIIRAVVTTPDPTDGK